MKNLNKKKVVDVKRILASLVLISICAFGTMKESIINKTLSYEGDKIYKTSKRGIELETLKTYNKKYKTNWKLKTLTHNQAVTIASSMYWDDRLNYVNPKVAMALFDYQFNSSPTKAWRNIHKAFGLTPKSSMSLELVAKINSMNPKVAVNIICDARLRYLKTLSSWGRHGKGWSRRVEDIRIYDK